MKHFEGVSAPFDIQEKAILLMPQDLRKDEKVKNFVFCNGNEGNMKDIADVAGIALRDIVFEEKGIEIEQSKKTR